MSKNTDFSKLSPYSRKNSIRTETGTKSGKQKTTGPNWPFHARSRASSTWECVATRAGRRQSQAARAPATRARLHVVAGRLVRSAQLASRFGPACRQHVSTPRWSCIAPVDGRRVSGACCRRLPLAGRLLSSFFFFFLLLSSLPSENRNTTFFSDFHIFRSVDLIDMIPSTKF